MESQALWDQLVLLEIRVFQDLRDPQDGKDPVDAPLLDPRAVLEREVRKVMWDSKELRGFLEHPEVQGGKDLQDPEDCQAKMAPQAHRAPQEPSELRELQDPQEVQALQESRESWAHRDLLELRERKVNGEISSRQHQFRPLPDRSVSS